MKELRHVGKLNEYLCSEGQSFPFEVNGHNLKTELLPCVYRAGLLVNCHFSVLTLPQTRLHIPYANCEMMCAVCWF